MKNTLKRTVIWLLVIAVLASLIPFTAGADTAPKKRVNVCFLLDTTHSLEEQTAPTDPNRMRFEATKMFIDCMVQQGNHVGSIAFSGDWSVVNPLIEIKSQADKDKVQADLITEVHEGDTTVGKNLQTAVDLIKNSGDPSLDSYIILLSDGQDTDPEEEITKGYEAAATNNIKVFTIALNTNKTAVIRPLDEIARNTGGKLYVAETPDDLSAAYMDFYELINDTRILPVPPIPISSDGTFTSSFTVPSRGVEEVNIIITSAKDVSHLTLTKPDGTELSESEVDAITSKATSFSLIKIVAPEGGDWELKGQGNPGQNVEIRLVYNDTITVETEKFTPQEMYKVTDTVEIKGYILDNGQRMTTDLDDYTAVLVCDSTPIGSDIPMTLDTVNSCFKANVSFTRDGTYSYHMKVEYKDPFGGSGIVKETPVGEIKLNVGNHAPVLSDDPEVFKKHFWVWPIFTKSGEFDLAPCASDPDGDALTYEVIDTPYQSDEYELSGDKFIVKKFNGSKNITKIRVKDGGNGYADFEIVITRTNIGVIVLIAIGAILLIILLIVFLKLRHDFLLKFSGTINITPSGDASVAISSFAPNRGRCPLSYFGVSMPNFDASKCYFQATGKNTVILKSKKKKFYVSGSMQPVKQLAIIGNGSETIIMAEPNSENCLYISFESMMMNSGGYMPF